MARLLVIDDRDQTVEMCHRQLPQFDYLTRCDRRIPCQVCEERDRGCKLKCAHDYFEAAEVLARSSSLPDLVVLDLHFAVPEERLLPEEKNLPTDPGERRKAIEDLRRRQGLLILEKLRADYPSSPSSCSPPPPPTSAPSARRSAGLLLRERGGRQPQPGRRDHPGPLGARGGAGGAGVLGAQPGHGPAPPVGCRAGALSAARADRGRDRHRQELPGRARAAPRSGAKGPLVVTDLSTIPATLLPAHLFGRGGARTPAPSRTTRRVRAGPRRHPVPRRDRQPRSGSAAAAPAGAGARAGHPPRRHQAARRRPQDDRRHQPGPLGAGAAGEVSAPTSTCG
jgi:CheY-like chemotaxis protein